MTPHRDDASPSPAAQGLIALAACVLVVGVGVAMSRAWTAERPGPIAQPALAAAAPAPRAETVRPATVPCDGAPLSDSAALADARRVLGGGVRAAVPFRDATEFPAAAVLLRERRPDRLGPADTVVVLRCYGGAYRTDPTSLAPRGIPDGPGDRFGVTDTDGDGYQEIYALSDQAGTKGYRVDVELFDPFLSVSSRYSVGGDYLAPASVSSARTPGPRSRAWMAERALALAKEVSTENDPYRDPGFRARKLGQEAWRAVHGWSGQVDERAAPREHPGPVPGVGEAYCATDDGRYEWSSFWGGAVWGHDRAAGRHFVVYVPPDPTVQSVATMVAGRDYLWLSARVLRHPGAAVHSGLLALDKRTRRLQVVPVPEVAEADSRCGFNCALGERLTARGGALYLDETRLTLPPEIDARAEFSAPRDCELRR